MTEVYLRGLSRWQAEQQRDAVADVHVTAYDGVAGAEYRDRQGFLRRFEQHVQQPGFDMTVADAGGLVGCAYGFRLARTGEWWSGFRGDLPKEIEELAVSGRTFRLAGLMVLPAHRRQGIATRLSERLLFRLGADLVVAAVERPEGYTRENAAASTLRAWGWSKLGELGPGASTPGRETAVRDVWIRRPLR
ncbi:GNAT family N-acetyltransferase [Streptomyces sp. NBC_00038]|uniref:GNAT family N-acetyltransferase n=1 Tax=Streptomyces sp. NBC_00038 TaxID=2903615 RepID=UPI002256E7BB|nr:GNAT family N-acetyltransferase [Streptomyces sp. NBC_00038]MCX5559223.1 GNAT family N-acetyltransferase [Streptomyces sp. NBC_00038]